MALPVAPVAAASPVVRLVKKKPSAEVKDLRRRVEEVERKIHGLEARMAHSELEHRLRVPLRSALRHRGHLHSSETNQKPAQPLPPS